MFGIYVVILHTNIYTNIMAYIPDFRAKRVSTYTKAITSQNNEERPRDPFYHTHRWRKKSEAQRANNPYCKICKDNGYITLGKVADHIIPISAGGDAMDDRNIQTLCNQCHNKKRQDESRGIIGKWKMNEHGFKIPVD
jgi:5-methylcytosine-specific restriction protein A